MQQPHRRRLLPFTFALGERPETYSAQGVTERPYSNSDGTIPKSCLLLTFISRFGRKIQFDLLRNGMGSTLSELRDFLAVLGACTSCLAPG